MSTLRFFFGAVLLAFTALVSRASVNEYNGTSCVIKTVTVHFEGYNAYGKFAD